MTKNTNITVAYGDGIGPEIMEATLLILKKAEARLAEAGRLPAICSERFPIKDTTIIKDTLLKIDTFLSGEYIFDTLRVNDTLYQIEYKPLEIINP